ncbi:hypothetical protein PT113_09310, partial [Erysipelothrix rhusiopathiae]|nr:hypothetical protein [Erysipelothrix rhusiopathiae]
YLLMSSKLIVYLLLISLSTYVIGLGLSQSKQKYKRLLLCLGIERIDMEKSPELHAQWNLCGSLCTVADVLIKDYETPLALND